jgi:glycosyltransferase involved in cell wall biosynthesis
MNLYPLVSIVTVVFNGKSLIENTISSVLSQTYKNIEYIIVDGGSNDGTLDIIEKYSDCISRWISESDDGIANAMNKAIDLSSGTLINYLHAGDTFSSTDTVKEIVESYLFQKWCWCFGEQFLINQQGKNIGYFIPPKFNHFFYHCVNTIPHQTVFCEKKFFDLVGRFNETYLYAMDYEFLLRLSLISTPKQFNTPVVNYLIGGKSSNTYKALAEELKAKNEVLQPNPLLKLVYLLIVSLRLLKTKLGITTFVKSLNTSRIL